MLAEFEAYAEAAGLVVKESRAPIVAPGDLAEWLVKQAGFPICPQKCRAFQSQMNQWGWLGCLTTHRQEIIDWFVARAGEHKVVLSSDDAWGLMKAGAALYFKSK